MKNVARATRGDEVMEMPAPRHFRVAKRALAVLFVLIAFAVVLVGAFAGRDLAAARNASEPARIENDWLRARQWDLTSEMDEVRWQLQAITDRDTQATSPAAAAPPEPPSEAPRRPRAVEPRRPRVRNQKADPRFPSRRSRVIAIGPQGEDEMSSARIFGVVLIVVGVLGLAFGRFSFTKETHEAKVGPLELSVKDKETVNIPQWAGVAAIVVGGVLLFVRSPS